MKRMYLLLSLCAVSQWSSCKARKTSGLKDVSIAPSGLGTRPEDIRVVGIVPYNYPGLSYKPYDGNSPYSSEVPAANSGGYSGEQTSGGGVTGASNGYKLADGDYSSQSGGVAIIRACSGESMQKLVANGKSASIQNLDLSVCETHPPELEGFDEVDAKDWDRYFVSHVTIKLIDAEKAELAAKKLELEGVLKDLGLEEARGNEIRADLVKAGDDAAFGDNAPDPLANKGKGVDELRKLEAEQKTKVDRLTVRMKTLRKEIDSLEAFIDRETKEPAKFAELKEGVAQRKLAKVLDPAKDAREVEIIVGAFKLAKQIGITAAEKKTFSEQQYELLPDGKAYYWATRSCSELGMVLPTAKELRYWHDAVWLKSGKAPMKNGFWTSDGNAGAYNGGFIVVSDARSFDTSWTGLKSYQRDLSVSKIGSDRLGMVQTWTPAMTLDGKQSYLKLYGDPLQKNTLCVARKGRVTPEQALAETFVRKAHVGYCIGTMTAAADAQRVTQTLVDRQFTGIRETDYAVIKQYTNYYRADATTVPIREAAQIVVVGLNKTMKDIQAKLNEVYRASYAGTGKDYYYEYATQDVSVGSKNARAPYSAPTVVCGSTFEAGSQVQLKD